MSRPLKRIAVTGGAGQIAYSLLFRIASGELLGPEQPIALHILETEQSMTALGGVVMELEDCAFPLLKEIHIGSDPYKIFEKASYAFLIGAKPRGPGMERKDLLAENGKIFVAQGKALNEVASQDLLTLVVGNPCNTNCLIAIHNAPSIDHRRFFAMTRLDQNRAKAALAKKAGASVDSVRNIIIWGNHSSTQMPDFFNAKIGGKFAFELIDENWLKNQFIKEIQQRGAAVIAARGKSSAASAAHAALQTMQSLIEPTPEGQSFSVALYAEKNPYGIDKDLVFSFPCRSTGNGNIEILPGWQMNGFLKEKILLSEKELMQERELVKNIIVKKDG